MKKTFLVLITLLILLTTGCSKKETNYDYSYLDFVDAEIIGANGYGILRFKVKDFDSTNCKSEEDYISIKKNIDALITNLSADKVSNLSNGDSVKISVNEAFTGIEGINIDLRDKEITISGLNEPVKLDLLSNENVVFYGLEGTNIIKYYFPASSKIPAEARDELLFEITIDDEVVKENKTIMTISCDITEDLKAKDPLYTNAGSYFMTKGLLSRTSGDSTVKRIAKASSIKDLGKEKVENLLINLVNEKENESELYRIVNLQRSLSDDFDYRMIAAFQNGDEIIVNRFYLRMAYLDGEIRVYEYENNGPCKIEDIFNNYEVLFQFYEPEPVIEEQVAEEA